MPLIPLKLPPGIVKVDSPHGAGGRYTDSDKVRFVNGAPEKWRGWVKRIETPLRGVARGAVYWTNVYGNNNAAFGTHLKLYALTGTDLVSDITPIRATSVIDTDPFETVNGETTVVVTHTNHGAVDGDFVTFADATAVGGITVDGEYQLTVIDANSYTIEHDSPAASDDTGGGALVEASYQINTGTASGVKGLGWGAGTWGTGTWGTPRADGIEISLRTWSLAKYGNDLLASPHMGGLYLWQESSSARAVVVANAPASIRAMFVTSERFVMALGTTSPMTVQWPDQDDITDWTPSAANTANERRLQSGSELVNGAPLADGISLVWSDSSLYVFQYTGSEFIYDSRLVAENCGLLCPKGFAVASGVAFWASSRSFKMYVGGVQDVPNSGDIVDYVFNDMNPDEIDKMWAFYDEVNNQVRWHYASIGSDEPDRYVDVNVGGDWAWTVGTLDRTTGTAFRFGGIVSLQVSPDGFVYLHDNGTDADGGALESFITYGLYALEGGSRNVDVMGIIPDCSRQQQGLDFHVYTKERPNSSGNFDEQTLVMQEGDEIGDVRVSGRHFGMTVRSNSVGGDFRLGTVNLEIQGGGTRR